MNVELVEVTADDGVTLAGMFLAAAAPPSESLPIDVSLMMHGSGQSFYQPLYRHFAQRLAALGAPSLMANNRGHDVVSGPIGGPLLGTGYENIDDCRLDWRAWISLLWERGYRKILLWGHSRGAAKTCYYLALERDARVKAAVLLSPPLLSYSRWLRTRQADVFRAHLAEAQQWVDRGEPDRPMRVEIPMPYISGAAQYLEKYGPEERYNIERYLAKMPCPVLAFSGTEEVANRFTFEGLPEVLDEAARQKPDLTPVSIPDGDHYYSGKQELAMSHVEEWLRTLR